MIGATLLMQEVARRGLMPAFLKFNPNHAPAGSSDGGQFTSGDGGSGNLTDNRTTFAIERARGEAAMLYGMNFIDATKIAYVSEAMLTGGDIDDAGISAGASDDHIEAAGELVKAIQQSSEMGTPLFRGLGNSSPLKNIEALKVGDSVTMDRITSFTADASQAAYYAAHTILHQDGVVFQERTTHRYELQTVGPVKAFATDKYSGLQHQEFITQGKFIVESVALGLEYAPGKFQYDRVIKLRQVGVF